MAEEDLQKEWRQIVIDKLNKLEDYQSRSNEILSKFSSTHSDVMDSKLRIQALEVANREFLSEDEIKKDYITRTEFEPIKRVVYGAVGTILLGILGAIISLVLRK